MSAVPLPFDVPRRTRGIDLSSANGRYTKEQWAAFGAALIRFVHVKAADWSRRTGSGYSDPTLDAHIDGAESIGADAGVYDFFHDDVDGRLQAESYARIIEPRAKRLTIRPTLDWEDAECAKRVGLRKSLDNAMLFLETIQKLTGLEPIVYSGTGMTSVFAMAGIDLSPMAAYDLWVAHYRFDPVTGRDYGLALPTVPKPWAFARSWQWIGNIPRIPSVPRIAGIEGDVDQDIFFGPYDSDDPHEWTFRLWSRGRVPVEPGLDLGPAGVHTIADDAHDSIWHAMDVPTKPSTPTSKSSQRLAAVNAPILGVDDAPPDTERGS